VTHTPDIAELQDLLRRCEGDSASQADLVALEALLSDQEQGAGWGSIRAGLQGGLEREASGVEVASGVLRQVSLPPAVPAGTFDALRGGLQAEAQRADLADAVMHFVDPTPDALLERHMAALAYGLGHEAGRVPAQLCSAVLDRVAPDRDLALEAALQVLADQLALQGASVELQDPVMQAVLGIHAQQLELCAMADGELAGDAKRAVAARLADDPQGRQAITAMAELGRQLRRALAYETAGHDLSDIWVGVRAQLGIEEQASWAADVAAGIQAEAGEIDIADLVMGSILPPARVEQPVVEEPAEAQPVRSPVASPADQPARPVAAWFRRLPILGFAASAAALLFVLNTMGPEPADPGTDPGPELAEVIFEISDVNTIEIQQLEVAQNAMVQVFQLEEGAPMVILIDEGFEPDETQGVTL
jgi:hypothetical protein